MKRDAVKAAQSTIFIVDLSKNKTKERIHMKNVCDKNGIRLGTWWGHFVGLGAWLGILCLIMGHVSAATMAYYRFEGSTSGGSSAPWVSDSSGNGYTLVGSFGTISQVSSVLNPIPVNSLSNLSAASLYASNFCTKPGPV